MLDVQRLPAAAEPVYLDSCRPCSAPVRQEAAFKMPVDFASYLLSASPPEVDLRFTLRDHFGLNGCKPRSYANIKSIISKSETSLASIPGPDHFDTSPGTLQTRCCSSPTAFYQLCISPPKTCAPAERAKEQYGQKEGIVRPGQCPSRQTRPRGSGPRCCPPYARERLPRPLSDRRSSSISRSPPATTWPAGNVSRPASSPSRTSSCETTRSSAP